MRKIIIGGVPGPIGGVTSYLRRLLYHENSQIDWLLDIYPGEKEPLRDDVSHKVLQLGSKLALVKWLWFNREKQINREVYFNFSRPRALLLTLLVPKVIGARWSLMLHHGELNIDGTVIEKFVRLAASRMDEIHYLSSNQKEYYLSTNIDERQLTN